jgi:hypothetical protein
MATSKQATKLLSIFEDVETDLMQKILGSGILTEVAKCSDPTIVDRDSLRKVLSGLRVEVKGFPIWRALQIGGITGDKLLEKLPTAGHRISDPARDIMGKLTFTTLKKRTTLKLVRVRVKDLGFTAEPTTMELLKHIREVGELCPAEVGPHLRLGYTDQPMNEWNWIAMEPIIASSGNPHVFCVGRSSSGSWLGTHWVSPGDRWYLENHVVFVARK